MNVLVPRPRKNLRGEMRGRSTSSELQRICVCYREGSRKENGRDLGISCKLARRLGFLERGYAPLQVEIIQK